MSKFRKINNAIIEQLKNANNTYPKDIADLSDIGNEIGIIIAQYFTEEDTKQDFISGLNHGISLTDGTHG